MSRYILSPEARHDLLEIRDYIASDNPEAARQVLARLKAACARIATMPKIGHPRQDLADESLCCWPVYSYVIVYRPTSRPVQIVRVLHGGRDFTRLF